MTWADPGSLCFKGLIFEIYRRTVVLAEGTTFVQELAAVPDIVRVYPVLAMSEVVMIQEYRREVDATILRVVSGTIEDGESPEEAGRRELREELGLLADRLQLFSVSIPMLKVRHRIHHFVVYDPALSEQQLEIGEDIRPWPIRLAGLDELLASEDLLEDSVISGLLRLRAALASAGIGDPPSVLGEAGRVSV